jgi:hypothetical protein
VDRAPSCDGGVLEACGQEFQETTHAFELWHRPLAPVTALAASMPHRLGAGLSLCADSRPICAPRPGTAHLRDSKIHPDERCHGPCRTGRVPATRRRSKPRTTRTPPGGRGDDVLPLSFHGASPSFADQGLLERLIEPDRVVMSRVCWIDDGGAEQVNRGFRIQHNMAIGPCKGRLRFHLFANLSILKSLAFEQKLKIRSPTYPSEGEKADRTSPPGATATGRSRASARPSRPNCTTLSARTPMCRRETLGSVRGRWATWSAW